jgi:hypothetical protein
MIVTWLCRLTAFLSIPLALAAGGGSPAQSVPSDKRIFWIIPNYRTIEESANVPPLTPKEKFTLAWKDSVDPGVFVLTGVLAAIGQANNSNSSFGQGAQGYGKRYGTTYADLAIGNTMTSGVFPSLLHQDPRYFRRGKGSGRSRLGYALSRTFITRADSGKNQFNYSEVLGNATATAISNAYYQDGRTASDNIGRLGIQLGLDGAGNVLKEFWPDLKRKLPPWMVR